MDNGVFEEAWRRVLHKLDRMGRVDWNVAMADATSVPAKKGMNVLVRLSEVKAASGCCSSTASSGERHRGAVVGTNGKLQGLTISVIIERIIALNGGQPYRVGSSLFVDDPQHRVAFLQSGPALIGWLQTQVDQVRWHNCPSCPSKDEYFRGVQRTARDTADHSLHLAGVATSAVFKRWGMAHFPVPIR